MKRIAAGESGETSASGRGSAEAHCSRRRRHFVVPTWTRAQGAEGGQRGPAQPDGRAHADQGLRFGVPHAAQEGPHAHARVDGHRDRAELQQSEHRHDEVVPRAHGEQGAGAEGDTLRVEDARRRIAFLVEPPEGAPGMDDLGVGTDRQGGKRGDRLGLFQGGLAQVAGDVASGDVHGPVNKEAPNPGLLQG